MDIHTSILGRDFVKAASTGLAVFIFLESIGLWMDLWWWEGGSVLLFFGVDMNAGGDLTCLSIFLWSCRITRLLEEVIV